MDVFLDGKRVCLAAKKLGAAPGLMTLGVTFRLRRKRVAWWSCYGSIVYGSIVLSLGGSTNGVWRLTTRCCSTPPFVDAMAER